MANEENAQVSLSEKQAALLQDLTLVITVRERCKHLRRALEYYSKFPIRVLVMDSSDRPCEIAARPAKFDSMYLPNTFYSDAVLAALERVETQYCLLGHDDDFFIPSALAECVEFLKSNPDFVGVSGYVGKFSQSKNLLLENEYPHMVGRGLLAETSEKRLIDLLGYFVTTYHGVIRTKPLVETIRRGRALKNLSVHGIATDCLLAIEGKIKELPLLFSVREQITTAQSSILGKMSNRPKFSQIARDPESAVYSVLYRACEDVIVDALGAKGVSVEKAKLVFSEAVRAYLRFCDNFGQLVDQAVETRKSYNIKDFDEVVAERSTQFEWHRIQALVRKHDISPIVPPLLVDDEGRTIRIWYNSPAIYFIREKIREFFWSSKRFLRTFVRSVRRI